MTTTEIYDQFFGQAIRRFRESKGWSMTEMASALSDAGLPNFHATTVSRLEAGTRPVKLSEAIVIAETFDLTLADLPSTAELARQMQHLWEQARRPEVQEAVSQAEPAYVFQRPDIGHHAAPVEVEANAHVSPSRRAAAPRPIRSATVEDVAKHLKVSRRTVERMITAGRIPVLPLGGRSVRLDLNAVDEALRA